MSFCLNFSIFEERTEAKLIPYFRTSIFLLYGKLTVLYTVHVYSVHVLTKFIDICMTVLKN